MASHLSLDGVIEQLAEAVAARVMTRLGGKGSAPLVYTTHKDGPNIPGKSHAWMVRMVKTMPGARKVGRDWTIAASDYDAWATAQDTSRVSSKMPCVKATMDDEAYADAVLAAAGYRVPKSVA